MTIKKAVRLLTRAARENGGKVQAWRHRYNLGTFVTWSGSPFNSDISPVVYAFDANNEYRGRANGIKSYAKLDEVKVPLDGEKTYNIFYVDGCALHPEVQKVDEAAPKDYTDDDAAIDFVSDLQSGDAEAIAMAEEMIQAVRSRLPACGETAASITPAHIVSELQAFACDAAIDWREEHTQSGLSPLRAVNRHPEAKKAWEFMAYQGIDPVVCDYAALLMIDEEAADVYMRGERELQPSLFEEATWVVYRVFLRDAEVFVPSHYILVRDGSVEDDDRHKYEALTPPLQAPYWWAQLLCRQLDV